MSNKFKVIISNKWFYNEVELSDDVNIVKVGTTKRCDVRLNRKHFYSDFEMNFENNGEQWFLNCLGNIYCSDDGILKRTSKALVHGDKIDIKYNDVDQTLFTLEFMVDFEFSDIDYNVEIDISNETYLTFGADNRCSIMLNDSRLLGDIISLTYKNGRYYITDNDSKYGVYVNGVRKLNTIELNNYDFFSILGFGFYLKNNKLYTSKDSLIYCNNLATYNRKNSKSSFKYPLFNRNTRIINIIPNQKITVLDPPSKPNEPKKNIISTVLPTLLTGGIVLVLRKKLMNYSNNGFLIISACTMVIGVLTSIFNYFNGNRQYKKDIKNRRIKYNEYIEKKREEIIKARQEELFMLNNKYYDLEKSLKLVEDFSGELFDRRIDDEDFLDVYLGIGDTYARRTIDYKEQEKFETDDDLLKLPKMLYDEFKYIQNAPIILPLKKCNVVGVVGHESNLYETLKNMTLDICIRQYYNDVKLFFIVNERQLELIKWVKFLPHIQNHYINMRNIAGSDETRTIIFEYLYNELERRRNAEQNVIFEELIIFVFDDRGIKNHPISRFMKNARKYNVTFIFFEIFKEDLPQYCDKVICFKKDNIATLIECSDGNRKVDYAYQYIDDYRANNVAIKLSPIYCEEISLEGTLTKNISLFELLKIYDVTDLDLADRWANSVVYKSMAAPLGVKASNEVVYLDIHEKAHGPHGLVAGTTGSGKSEILQSYILSLATLFSPYEVGFVIIDFKGGGMANQFRNLPHLNGAITNIDGKQINRSLLSIRAELNKRQQYFAKANVNHIDQYIKKFKDGEVSEPLPHLIIIVDEFAELKAEHPDFMKELISTARIGRSLGVHLILATQKPSGQVNEQIWSNSKFKLCLKVQTASDSKEVIKSPLAAEIIEPGRAYFQVGNNEIFELFQSAYSGCSSKLDSVGKGFKDFYIASVDFFGRRSLIYEQKKKKSEAKAATQLEAITNYVEKFCIDNNITKLNDICLPALEEKIKMPDRLDLYDIDGSMTIEYGIYDAPELQYQGRATYRMAEENMMIIGSTRTGKTSLIQTIIKCATLKYSPSELNIYIFDFASMFLKNYEKLNHVSAVACMYESDKIDNILKTIKQELEDRRKKLSDVGVSSIISYREAGYNECPQILLIIDNLTVFSEFEADKEGDILMLSREGISLGISIIVANVTLKGIGYRYLSNFAKRIALYCNDTDIYRTLFEKCRIVLDEIPGRSIIEIEKERFECQLYQAFEGDKEIDRINELKEYITLVDSMYDGIRAKKILSMPELLSKKFIIDNFEQKEYENNALLGINYDSMQTISLDINKAGVFSVSATDKKDRLKFMEYFMSELNYKYKNKLELFICDDINKELEQYNDLDIVRQYHTIEDKTQNVLEDIDSILEERYEKIRNGVSIENENTIGLVINNALLIEKICKTADWITLYRNIVEKYKDLNVFVMYPNIENARVSFSACEILKNIKMTPNLLYFGDLGELKIVEVSSLITRRLKKKLNTGDAYYIVKKDYNRIKTITENF